jgi:hypothetical protein
MPIDDASVQDALQKLFPDATIDQGVVSRVKGALAAGGTTPPAVGPAAPPGVTFYRADAQHARVRGATSTFVGHLPIVRVRLPATGSLLDVPVIQTPLGVLIPNDRKIASVEQAPNFTTEPVAQIDLLTPPRAPDAGGGRFGAIAVYLCYDTPGAAAPTSYILEAGTATGQPQVLFPSQGMNPILNRQTSYEPTPFSKSTNFYSGKLTMNGNEPQSLVVSSTDTSGQGPGAGPTPYITVTIQYTKLAAPPSYDPLALLVEAAARVGIIGNAIGVNPGIAPEIAAALAGWALSWVNKP